MILLCILGALNEGRRYDDPSLERTGGAGILPSDIGNPAPDWRRVRTAFVSKGNGGSGVEPLWGDGVVDDAGVVLRGERKPVPTLDVLCVRDFSAPRRDAEPDVEPDLGSIGLA